MYTCCINFTAPRSRTRTTQLGCVRTDYTKLGGPVVPCTPGVRLRDRSRMLNRRWRTICSECHFRTPPVRICTAPRSRTQTAHLSYVYKTCTNLGGAVGPCTTGVRLPEHSRIFTRRRSTMCSERHFRTPRVRICIAPRNRTGTAHLGYMYTTCTKLGGPVEPCTTGV